MSVAAWVRELTESVLGGPPLVVGSSYVHPDDGVITVTSGQYWGAHGLSNFWRWRVESTGEIHAGYGDRWPKVDP